MRLYRGQKIADLLLERQRVEAQLTIMDRSPWYTLNESLVTGRLWDAFVLSYFDQGTQDFLDESTATSGSVCWQMYYALMTSILSTFLTKTSINGVLNRGGMFLFSESQFSEFLQFPAEWTSKGKKVLDLGAGDGGITKIMGNFFEEVYATEMSQVMQYRLRQRGFKIEDADKWQNANRKYDLISVLNLLDRHYNPSLLLENLHDLAIRSGCPVLIAVVCPIRQYVEFHPSRNTTRADTRIQVKGSHFEEHVESLVNGPFAQAGFELMRWTKLPYLCEGDFNKPYYLLYDAVFLLRALPLKDSCGSAGTSFQCKVDNVHEIL